MFTRALFILAFIPSQVAADGAEIYADHCADCHGLNLEGEPEWRTQKVDGSYPAPPHDDEGHTWHHSDGVLFDYVRLGGAEMLKRIGVSSVRSGMPAFDEILTDDEIVQVLDFIKSEWSPRSRNYQRNISENSEKSK